MFFCFSKEALFHAAALIRASGCFFYRRVDMGKLKCRLLVALATFLVGISIAMLWLNYSHIPGSLLSTKLRYFTRPQISFEYQGFSLVMIGGRGCIAVHTYKANDGLEVRMTTDTFDSPDLAAEELERRLKGNVEIIERLPVVDEQGQQAGERVIMRRYFDKDKPSQFYLLETRGAEVYCFSGPSVQHLLALERHLTY